MNDADRAGANRFQNKTKQNMFSKSQRHARMIINLKKKEMDQLENCPQFAHKLF